MNNTEKTAHEINTLNTPQGTVLLWYLGQSGFAFKTSAATILADPYLSDSVDRASPADPAFARSYPPPVLPRQLKGVTAVLCTHSHLDHTDPDTLLPLAQNPGTLFCSPEADYLEKIGLPPGQTRGVSAGQPFALPGCTVHPIRAQHAIAGQPPEGPAVSYLLQFETGLCVFVGGDMCLYQGLAQTVGRFAPTVAIVPINGRDAAREAAGIVGNTDAREAVHFALDIGVELLIPCHYDLYPGNGADAQDFLREVQERAPGLQSRLFLPGECCDLLTRRQ